ncbi:hypothetical protein [Leptospira meyeri]|uniref:hypothetical protein n=1 Tax=Leptospira meyeri TaxID=29508 RepID=UPI0002BFD649|nr:hypothetical protein [Leptospira meyeri]EMJ87272.1 hypothetical protein LEP1GSC196_2957 [Leptospira meyeri serovar Semaranga str. Veldrot Semarang 173]
MSSQEKCYRCEKLSTSREHIPAQSFFPKEYREELITVPSCDEHNTKKSTDDEYVRNLFAMNAEINQVGYDHGIDKVVRSFLRNPLFKKRVFGNAKDTFYLGEPTKEAPIEKERLIEYLAGIGYGLFRYDFDKNYDGHWYVHVDFQLTDPTIKSSLSLPELKIRDFFRNTNFPKSKTKNPEVFQYSYFKEEDKLIYKLVFYERICIYLATKNLLSKR